MNFGERIKKLRMEKKWTQEYVCEKLNISSGALSRYETGMYEPKSLALIKDFADLFKVSTDFLLGKSDVRNPEKMTKTEFVNLGSFDTNGLDKEEIEEIKRQIEYIKWKKKNKNQ